jgi:hypothetical protein
MTRADMAREEVKAWMTGHSVTVKSVFVPFSQSVNKDQKSRFDKINGQPAPEYSLNWKVSIFKDAKMVLKTDYMAGCGHCYAYKHPRANKYLTNAEIERECEVGEYRVESESGHVDHRRHVPDSVDVISHLSSDSEVYGYSNFEDWASVMGYDTDSRAVEKIYLDCREIADKMYRAFGVAAMKALSEACQDF